MIDLTKPLFALYPTAKWTLNGDTYDGITWLSEDISKPTEEELLSWVDPNAYKAKRAAEYPPITDYLDGVVKGDQTQIDKYIADCLAVKAKYPKVTT
jgi:hypothetical protein